MSHQQPEHPAPFGTLLGIAPGNVPAYSSDYASASDVDMPDRQAFRSYLDGTYMGYKWQCVEFARRWLFINFGYVFNDVAMAYDIFRLRSVRLVHNNTLKPLFAFRNGSRRAPEPGALLIWDEGGDFERTGHVAIITELLHNRVRIAEQNYDHQRWPQRRSYARELELVRQSDGGYLILDPQSRLLGWMIQTEDDTGADTHADPTPELLNTVEVIAGISNPSAPWLDTRRPELAAYVADMGGHRMSENPDNLGRHYHLSETAARELKHAANELHAMFMHATYHVLADDERLARFNIPQNLWAKLHQSWDNRRNQTVCGRLDFSMSERGLKVYEYNADSASCLLECAAVQDAWARQHGLDQGESPGDGLFEQLVDTWQDSGISGTVHLMRDNDPEETYHALYMQSAMEAAGLRCRLIEGLDQLNWNQSGEIVDADGEPVQCVWKTWAWETALEEIRLQLDEDQRLQASGARAPRPRLADVLLRKGIMVFEPFWTAIPSNKAILPVLWELFPDHPYLLESAYDLNVRLQREGYVAKPIGGRCGLNISIVNARDHVIAETSGGFDSQPQIYQALFPLPKVGPYYLQHSAFIVDGKYAGAGVRVDPSMVITGDSEVLPARIVPDRQLQ